MIDTNYSQSTEPATKKSGLLRRAGVALVLGLLLLVALAGCGDEATPTLPAASNSGTGDTAGASSGDNSADQGAIAPTVAEAAESLAPTTTAEVAVADVPTQVAGAADAAVTPLPPTEVVVQPAESATTTTYTVVAGDTLSGLAERFGVSVQALAQANGIEPSDYVYIDQVLKIPASIRAASGTGTSPAPTEAAPAAPEESAAPPAPTEAVEAPPAQAATNRPAPVTVNGRTYDAYIQTVNKSGQFYQYTCEFDAVWIVLKSYGFDPKFEDLVAAVGLDTSIEPYYQQTENGAVVYGGDINNYYSGDYKKNFLGRATGNAMRKAFEAYDLQVTPTQDRASLEEALLRGELVWIKTTVDFKAWTPVTWIMPDGSTTTGVLGNDHALVIKGFNDDGVVVSDPLGPTSTNRQRLSEYLVPWDKFMSAWGAQNYDGLAVAPPAL